MTETYVSTKAVRLNLTSLIYTLHRHVSTLLSIAVCRVTRHATVQTQFLCNIVWASSEVAPIASHDMVYQRASVTRCSGVACMEIAEDGAVARNLLRALLNVNFQNSANTSFGK